MAADKVKIFCNSCRRVTNHSLLFTHDFHDVDEFVYQDFDGRTVEHSRLNAIFSYQVVACKGCDSITYRTVEDWSGLDEVQESVYPTRNFELIRNKQGIYEAKVLDDVPPQIRKIYEETIQAYNANMEILCSAGLRALVEGVCKHFKMPGKYLPNQIEGLANNKLIGEELSKSLKAHKHLGNDALHGLIHPNKPELLLAIGLLETTLDNLFSVPKRHKDLADKMTRRIVGQ